MISVKDLKDFDPAEYLESDEDIAIFLDESFNSGVQSILSMPWESLRELKE